MALYLEFTTDLFQVYKQFAARRLQPYETADVYLAKLWKLAVLFGRIPDKALMYAFVAGRQDLVK